MAYSDASNYNEIKSMKGFPIGTIVPWAGPPDIMPTGWVPCNGRVVSNTTYPLLQECIGNVYGGVAGSTFALPPLNNTSKGIMDIFRGHYDHLKTSGDSATRPAHAPDSSSISDDPFWSQVGQTNNGNEHGSTASPPPSTIDLVGEITSPPNFIGQFTDITINEATEQFSVSFNSRKLGDGHLTPHGHNVTSSAQPGVSAEAWARLSRLALQHTGTYSCGTRPGWDFLGLACEDRPCRCLTTVTRVSRTIDYIRFGNSQGDLGLCFGRFGTAAGGGSVFNLPPASVQDSSQGYRPGNGRGVGDMLSSGQIFFTSLSNEETTWTQIVGHNHAVLNYTLRGVLRVVNPGIVNNISINNVRINNDAGKEFASITMTSATPNLSMMYIIKAF